MEEFDEFSQCVWCAGFYGPNFGQPVCNTCHLFLYMKDINIPDEEVYIEKTDSGDSGTEEPDNEEEFYNISPNVDTPAPSSLNPACLAVQDKVGNDGKGNSTEARLHSDQNVGANQHICNSVNGLCGSLGCCASSKDLLVERILVLSTPRDYPAERINDGLVDSLPPEVLLVVFSYLDDIALWTAARVCSRWKQIVETEAGPATWLCYVRRRWPLFHPQYQVVCWHSIYSKLLMSSPCRYCLESIMLKSTPPIEENSWRRRRLRSELKALRSDPPEGIEATPLDRHCCHWQASITGPQGSPYEGGLFFLYLQIPHSYPMRPPVVRFMTRVFHPNISRHGDVGLDSIQHNWSLALTISKVLISIQSLLTDPFCKVCMEPEIGKLYEKDRHGEFTRIARLWTWKFAIHDYLLNDVIL